MDGWVLLDLVTMEICSAFMSYTRQGHFVSLLGEKILIHPSIKRRFYHTCFDCIAIIFEFSPPFSGLQKSSSSKIIIILNKRVWWMWWHHSLLKIERLKDRFERVVHLFSPPPAQKIKSHSWPLGSYFPDRFCEPKNFIT